MTIRPMSLVDVTDGLRLCRASNWNQLDADWRFFLENGGARLVLRENRIIGSVAWLPFGADFAWLSMMLVDPAARREGTGTSLMQAALEALKGKHVRLDATPDGEPLYRRFGFVEESSLARTQASGGDLSLRVRAMKPADLPGVFARDRAVFGADRSKLLADLYRRAPDLAWIGRLGAYCFGRPGYLNPQIGPVVASNSAAARELVDHCMAMHHGQSFVIDVPKRDDGLGFKESRPFLRMSLGEPRPFGAPEQVFAITGPEFG